MVLIRKAPGVVCLGLLSFRGGPAERLGVNRATITGLPDGVGDSAESGAVE